MVGNANSDHWHGQHTRHLFDVARADLGSLFEATGEEIVATSGATESIDLAILGSASALLARGKTHVVTTRIEHGAMHGAATRLRTLGFEVDYVDCDADGVVAAQDVLAAMGSQTGLLSVMHVNNETGAIQPVEEIAEGLAGKDVLFHVDAAQSFGKLQDALKHPRIDLVSFSGHKVHAPRGIGGLLVRARAAGFLSPRLGGTSNVDRRRPGTPCAALLSALALAGKLAVAESASRRVAWAAYQEQAVRAFRSIRATFNTSLERALPNVLSLRIDGVDAESARMVLQELVSVSNGSACHAGGTPSHVLRAMGLSPAAIQSTMRWSWCHLSEEAPWDEIVRQLRKLRA